VSNIELSIKSKTNHKQTNQNSQLLFEYSMKNKFYKKYNKIWIFVGFGILIDK
jgi:hypothetical protein